MDDQDLWAADRPEQRANDGELPPELRAVARRYAVQPVPRPTAADTARLMARLLAEEPALALAAPQRQGRVRPALRVARWRTRLLGPWFWVASVLLLLGGAAATPLLHDRAATLPLVVLAPLTAVLGLAHAVRTSAGGLRAVEASAPLGLAEMTLGLVLAIVGFDCTLGVVVTVGLALLHWAPFVALLAAWLGPLLLLAGLSLPIALRWGTVPAAIVGSGPWLVLAVLAFVQPGGIYAQALALPQNTISLTLHLAAAVVGIGLLALVSVRAARWPALNELA